MTRIYTVAEKPPEISVGKTFVRIPYDIRVEEPKPEDELPEGMYSYSYLEEKYTREQYEALLMTRKEAEEIAAENLVNMYELINGGEE